MSTEIKQITSSGLPVKRCCAEVFMLAQGCLVYKTLEVTITCISILDSKDIILHLRYKHVHTFTYRNVLATLIQDIIFLACM